MANRIQNLKLSASELRVMGFHESFVKDYSLMSGNMDILSTQFQWLKSGSQAVTGGFSAITGWAVERDTGSFTDSSSAGTITIPKTGDYQLDCFVQGDAATGLTINAQLFTGGAWNDIAGATAMATQHAVISGCLFSPSVSELVRIVVKGGTMNITTGNARVTIGRKS